ncbi:conserved hypothetical protein [Methylobacterium sp. 4-46]|uniref:hypothetical protein n=1 Tax=unclassified Methylobacterium TaxID=2615210 RepID=UPI000152CF31|nr:MULTISPECIES: hypothetical protein [Methylobacterium]ACA15035.1 conserved hypothetical protein [Methylobacterium sp. 4-46]WFT80773.1 hypothetical protein QA634_02385 [Methylobacterium nodulans]
MPYQTDRDLDRALADIVAIRSQIARDTHFRGLGPATIAATGGIALLAAGLQALWLMPVGALAYLLYWIAVAALAVALIGAEAVTRSRRLHSGLADAMIGSAVEQFLPALAAGALVALVLVRVAPDSLWLLPGLWQVFVSLGLFAATRTLPRAVSLAGAWYLLAGLAGLVVAAGTRDLSPWAMGLPFGIGQVLLALILHLTCRDADV